MTSVYDWSVDKSSLGDHNASFNEAKKAVEGGKDALNKALAYLTFLIVTSGV